MSFKQTLIDKACSAESAYLRYITNVSKNEFIGFAFVEDLDDIDFYQHALSDFGDIYFIGCGGRSGVISFYEAIGQRHGEEANFLFFIDRDWGGRDDVANEICVTEAYSWESCLCCAEALECFLRRRVQPQADRSQVALAVSFWRHTLGEFIDLLHTQYRLIQISGKFRLSLGAAEAPLVQAAVVEVDRIRPGECRSAHLAGIQSRVEFSDELIAVWDRSSVLFREDGALRRAHGKKLFTIFRKSLEEILQIFRFGTKVNISSAREFALALRIDLSIFQPFRDYAKNRLQ